MSSEALAVVSQQDAAQALMPVMKVEQATERYQSVVKFVSALMNEGHDFGQIPGTEKKTLLKPGAEKLTTFFGLTKRFQVTEKVEDWTGIDHGGEPFFYYLYRCALYNGDLLIAESDGSCNSFEKKYRWRQADRVCPVCAAPAIMKSKFEDGGWYCFSKKGGCGTKFAGGDPEIESQQVGRIPNPDVCDLVNTIQKIAQKRAFVAATLLAVNASEFFTQDVEDFEDFNGEARPAAAERRTSTNPPPRTAAQPAQSNGKSPEEKALDEQLLAHCVKEKGERNAQAFFNAMYAKKTLEQKRAIVAAFLSGTPAARAPMISEESIHYPQPSQPPASQAQDVVEGEIVPELSPARLDIDNLCEQLHARGCENDHINAKIAQVARGVYATDEIPEEHLPKVRMMLQGYIGLGDRAAAEMAKEFQPKGGAKK
jgi:hypothetical protein